jgi:hypothetical protein
MSRAWVFQANPAQYDIDAALAALDLIWWRIPQYTADARPGDAVVLWRSGAQAGIVGVGIVVEPPQLRSLDPSERQFVLDEDKSPNATTRALIAVGPAPFVSKDRVRAMPGMATHQIVTAPMGTVFPLTPEEWAVLSADLPELPSRAESTQTIALTPPFAWEQRAKGVMPMPGGYDGYLTSTRRICEIVEDTRPTSQQLVHQLCVEFGLKDTAARLRESFLRKMGLLILEGGALQLSSQARQWLETGDDRLLIALLHGRCQFIGEMIAELEEPRTTDELLSIVGAKYHISWDSNTQITNRRGWLQSAGMISTDPERRLVITPSGNALISELILYDPSSSKAARTATPPLDAAPNVPEPERLVAPENPVEVLAAEIEVASTDSGNPDRFERAVRDAFTFLGFEAQLLGGSGRTDVLLEAPLGREETYKISVDAKTTGSGSLGDQQVDWATLVEHRERHRTDYSLLVGPNPSLGRLMERAHGHAVAVLSARQLAGICLAPPRTPRRSPRSRYGLSPVAGEQEMRVGQSAFLARRERRRRSTPQNTSAPIPPNTTSMSHNGIPKSSHRNSTSTLSRFCPMKISARRAITPAGP